MIIELTNKGKLEIEETEDCYKFSVFYPEEGLTKESSWVYMASKPLDLLYLAEYLSEAQKDYENKLHKVGW